MIKSVEQASRVDGSVLLSHVIPAKEYYGFKIARGQNLRIIDFEGQQVMDMVFLSAANPTEHLSVVGTNYLNRTWKLTKGHTLYSIWCNPIAKIVEDTVGMNVSTGGYCTEHANYLRYGMLHTRNCYDNLANALAPFGIDKSQIPESSEFCPFMNLSYDPDGTHEIRAPISQAGDFIDFEAQMDLLIGLSCCPAERNPCNNFRAKPMKFILYQRK